jgi:transcription termination factor Rho
MSALDRSELEASPLADLHAIADQIGLDGFRRLRKQDLIEAILTHAGVDGHDGAEEAVEAVAEEAPEEAGEEPAPAPRSRRSPRSRARAAGASDGDGRAPARRGRATRRGVQAEERGAAEPAPAPAEKMVEGAVELLGNGSAFLRVQPPEPSDADVYISAAQVRRCELVSGDRVSGPARAPRRSERYPSLVRVEEINGEPAERVSEGARYESLEVAYPSERLALASEDPTLKALEWLTPIGKGSRVLICGGPRAGKSEIAKRLLGVLASEEGLHTSVVLAGVRPEEIAAWQEGPVAPAGALTFAASGDAQGQAVELAVESAKRLAARGTDALVVIDSLDGLPEHVARRVFAQARKLLGGGSLTIIATATRPLGGESTLIALDPLLASSGRFPALDLLASGTLRPELLVGEEGAEAIAQARAAAAAER